jgi:hypothetical protein
MGRKVVVALDYQNVDVVGFCEGGSVEGDFRHGWIEIRVRRQSSRLYIARDRSDYITFVLEKAVQRLAFSSQQE